MYIYSQDKKIIAETGPGTVLEVMKGDNWIGVCFSNGDYSATLGYYDSVEEAVAVLAQILEVLHTEIVAFAMPLHVDERETGSIYKTSIDALGLSIRPENCLKRAGIFTIGDLVKITPRDFLQIRNLGRKSGQEIVQKLMELGIDCELVNQRRIFYGGEMKEVRNEV